MKVTITNDWIIYSYMITLEDLEVGRTYDVNELVHHKNMYVRGEAAAHGYGLDVLVNDKEFWVREAVANYLREHNYKTIFNWAKDNGVDIDINEWLNSDEYVKRAQVARQGYGLDVLVNDKEFRVRDAIEKYLKEHNYKSVDDWAKANPDKVHGNLDTKTTNTLKDFVYKVDDSNTLKVESSYESVETFFSDSSKESYASNETLVILAVDAKVPLIKLEKSIKDDKQVYKFIVDITNDDGDRFLVNSIISSKEKFNQLLESTINALNEYPQFSKYTSDLESCL